MHDNLPLQTWYIFQRLNKSEFKPSTEVKKQDLKQKGTMLQEHQKKKNHQKTTPQDQPQYDTNPRSSAQQPCHWSRAQTNTAEAIARTENKRNVVCGKYPGKLNRNKYSTVKRYICFVNVTRVRKSNGCFHGFKSMLNTNYINTFSEHTGSSVCYF